MQLPTLVFVTPRNIASQSRHKLTQSAVRDYLMSTSHDMRTPAHGIMTAAQLLASQLGVIADTEASFLVTAMRCACDLLISKARIRTRMAALLMCAPCLIS